MIDTSFDLDWTLLREHYCAALNLIMGVVIPLHAPLGFTSVVVKEKERTLFLEARSCVLYAWWNDSVRSQFIEEDTSANRLSIE